MPELPEVETVRADLETSIVCRLVSSVKIDGTSSVVGRTPAKFTSALVGRQIVEAGRRAKWLLFKLDNDLTLAVHLRMTGQLIHVAGKKALAGRQSLAKSKGGMIFETGEPDLENVDPQTLPNSWTRATFVLDDGSTLYFNDIRRFGTLEILNPAQLEKRLLRYGIEPLHDNWNETAFVEAFKGRRCSLKALLLNQVVIAGLGNIYVDEACFRAGLRPRRQAGRVPMAARQRLFGAITEIITAAVESRGTSFSDYRDPSGETGGYSKGLRVYGRGGESCLACDTPISKVMHGGRGTHFCPTCQK